MMTLREMTPADVPAVMRLAMIQNERDGTNYGVPQVFDAEGRRRRNIALALVTVDEKTGEVLQGHVYEVTVEGMTFGTDTRATVASLQQEAAVMWKLRERGFEDLHILVPASRAAQMRHGLRRLLKVIPTGMVHFYRLLDPHANAELCRFYESRERDREAS